MMRGNGGWYAIYSMEGETAERMVIDNTANVHQDALRDRATTW
jgi:hypothetical protein